MLIPVLNAILFIVVFFFFFFFFFFNAYCFEDLYAIFIFIYDFFIINETWASIGHFLHHLDLDIRKIRLISSLKNPEKIIRHGLQQNMLNYIQIHTHSLTLSLLSLLAYNNLFHSICTFQINNRKEKK